MSNEHKIFTVLVNDEELEAIESTYLTMDTSDLHNAAVISGILQQILEHHQQRRIRIEGL